jgi:uncharacterized membrane protein
VEEQCFSAAGDENGRGAEFRRGPWWWAMLAGAELMMTVMTMMIVLVVLVLVVLVVGEKTKEEDRGAE